jgi:hypothetical protein
MTQSLAKILLAKTGFSYLIFLSFLLLCCGTYNGGSASNLEREKIESHGIIIPGVAAGLKRIS